MREENQYRIAELILRYLETKASLEEITELKEWISLSEENRIFFQKNEKYLGNDRSFH